MSDDVGGEHAVQSGFSLQLVQCPVVGPEARLVLVVGLARVGGGEDGEDVSVGLMTGGVAVDDVLHAGLQFDGDELAGLMPLIRDHAVGYLLAAQRFFLSTLEEVHLSVPPCPTCHPEAEGVELDSNFE